MSVFANNDSFGASRAWDAELDLKFGVSDSRTVLKKYSFKGPLQVQKLFYHDKDKADAVKTCHCYVLHPPGGLVSGDRLNINVSLENEARALITTPSAGKFYKCDSCGVKSRTCNKFILNNSQLEWLPLENIFFNGAVTDTCTVFELDNLSSLLTWEINCFGRKASDESFDKGRINSKVQIIRDGQPLLFERLLIDGNHKELPFLHNFSVQASLYAITTKELNDRLQLRVNELSERLYCNLSASRQEGFICSLSTKQDLVIFRLLGSSSYKAFSLLKDIFVYLRPFVFNKEAVIPRIWNT